MPVSHHKQSVNDQHPTSTSLASECEPSGLESASASACAARLHARVMTSAQIRGHAQDDAERATRGPLCMCSRNMGHSIPYQLDIAFSIVAGKNLARTMVLPASRQTPPVTTNMQNKQRTKQAQINASMQSQQSYRHAVSYARMVNRERRKECTKQRQKAHRCMQRPAVCSDFALIFATLHATAAALAVLTHATFVNLPTWC